MCKEKEWAYSLLDCATRWLWIVKQFFVVGGKAWIASESHCFCASIYSMMPPQQTIS